MLQGISQQKLKPPSSPAPLSLYWGQRQKSICTKHVSPRSPQIVFPSFRLSRLHLSNPERLYRKYLQRWGLFWLHITRSLGYTGATTWATELSTLNRTTPFRKANFAIASSSGGGLQISWQIDLQRGFVRTPRTPPPTRLWANFASSPCYLHEHKWNRAAFSFTTSYQELNPGELKGVCMGVLELPLTFLSRINNSLIFSLSCQLYI